MFFVYFELGPWSAWSHDLPGMFAEKLIVNNYCVCIFEQNAIIFNSATAYMRAMNYNRIFFTNTGRALTSGTDSDPRILTTKTCHIRWISSWPFGVYKFITVFVFLNKTRLYLILRLPTCVLWIIIVFSSQIRAVRSLLAPTPILEFSLPKPAILHLRDVNW